MTSDELPFYCLFERRIVGPQGAVLLRRHIPHVKQCVKAIQRRDHPEWSSQRTDFRVEEAA